MSTISPDSDQISAVGGSGPAPGSSGLDVNQVGTRPGATETDAVTGPMPVVDLAEGHLHVSLQRGVTIIQVDGGLDDALAAVLVPAIEAAIAGAKAVVLDLDQVTLLDRSALAAVCEAVSSDDGTSCCLVAGRLSGRLVLDRWGIPESFAVFGSVADALQARAYVESGYGTGWQTVSED